MSATTVKALACRMGLWYGVPRGWAEHGAHRPSRSGRRRKIMWGGLLAQWSDETPLPDRPGAFHADAAGWLKRSLKPRPAQNQMREPRQARTSAPAMSRAFEQRLAARERPEMPEPSIILSMYFAAPFLSDLTSVATVWHASGPMRID